MMAPARTLWRKLGIALLAVSLMVPTWVGASSNDESARAVQWLDSVWEHAEKLGRAVPAGDSSQQRDPIWIEGEALRYFLDPLSLWLNTDLAPLMTELSGAKLSRGKQELRVSIHFTRPLTLPLAPKGKSLQRGMPSRLELAQEVRFWISVRGDKLVIGGFDEVEHMARLKLHLNPQWNTVKLRRITMNLATGRLQVEASLLRDFVRVVAQGQFYDQRFQGVSFWDSLRSNWLLVLSPFALLLI